MDSNLPPPTKHCLHVIDTHINKAGDPAFLHIMTIARESGYGRSTVIAHLNKACAALYLTKRLRGFAKRKWKSLEYLPRVPDDEFAFSDDVQQLDASDVQQLDALRRKDHRKKTTPNPSPVGEGDDLEGWFKAEFWPRYSRKEGERYALRALRGLLPALSPDERPLILAALDRLTSSSDHVPRASRWLRSAPWRARARPKLVCRYCGGVAVVSAGAGWACNAPACKDRALYFGEREIDPRST